MTKLADLAAIHTGYTFRRSLKNATSGDTAIIQMKDAWPDGIVQPNNFARLDMPGIPPHHLLRAGDLVFRARGQTNCTMLLESVMERIVCIAPLIFIRILSPQTLLPAYLNWFINLPCTQKKLAACAHGKTNRMIVAHSMGNLQLVLPSPERQKEIVLAVDLDQQIVNLQKQILENQRTTTAALLLQFARDSQQLEQTLAQAMP